MGGGNAQKSKTARDRKMKENAKKGQGSQLASNAAACNIVCQVREERRGEMKFVGMRRASDWSVSCSQVALWEGRTGMASRDEALTVQRCKVCLIVCGDRRLAELKKARGIRVASDVRCSGRLLPKAIPVR
ncbi:unnamed protein product [Phaeothamnion confervicola]